MNILIVEDAADQRMILVSILKKYGHDLHVAENGKQALELLHSNDNIQLVISDWMMPEMDGLELCRKIRSQHFSRYIYFILLTGISDDNAVIEGMNIGADDFLRKPLNFRELQARLKAGIRVLDLEQNLADKNRQLKGALHTIENDLESAATVLKNLLPAPQSLLDTAFYWCFQPSRILGGDMLGYQVLGDEHIAFYQIDVSGHGIPSALFSFSLNHLLSDCHPDSSLLLEKKKAIDKQQSVTTIRSPESVLSSLNERFQSSAGNMIYFTIVYGVLDVKSGLMQIAHAGHPSTLIISGEKRVVPFEKRGAPIGLVPDFPYESEVIQLSRGDTIFCYTDGITESMDEKDRIFGEERLFEVFKKHSDRTPEKILDNVMSSVVQWQGGNHFEDDVSCLLIKWKQSADQASNCQGE